MTLKRRLAALKDAVEATPRIPPADVLDAFAVSLRALAAGDEAGVSCEPLRLGYTIEELSPALSRLTFDELRVLSAQRPGN